MSYFEEAADGLSLLKSATDPATPDAVAIGSISSNRPRVQGKFLFFGEDKFFIKGISYGAFRPNEKEEEYHDLETVERDFRLMAAHGFNTVRIPHTMPPRSLLDIAHRHGLKVMVGLSAEQFVGYLIDRRKKAPDIPAMVREKVRAVAGHPALLCYGIGNEIPAAVARWIGRRRIERYLHQIYRAVKEVDPQGLVTYVNYPTTEYLQLPFLDFVSFNVYLESPDTLKKYLARLQNIAGDRPLLMSEVGLDAMRHGEEKQSEVLDWQIRTSFAAGCAGTVIFSWTDEWFRGGSEVDDWAFGLTDRERNPKPALASVENAFAEVPFPLQENPPRFSVVVCTCNGSATIRESLESLLKLEYPNYEIIVVNDGSTDRTRAIVSDYTGINLINTENRGLSHARNVGMRAASGDYVAYIDDDAWPDSHWLHYLNHAFAHSGHSGIGGPNLPPSDEAFTARCVANSPGGPLHVLLTDDVAEHIPGCNMTFRKADLQAIGGFDPAFRVAGDDVDVCWKIQKQGWTLGYHAAALVWHRRRNSVPGYLKQQMGYGKAEALLETKWPEKYNSIGHVCWGGRVYGNGITRVLGCVSRVYHGPWGAAPFQSIHESAPNYLFSFSAMPEWWILILGLAGLSALGLIWSPLLLAFPFFTIAVGLVLIQNAISVRKARISQRLPRCRHFHAAQMLTFFLHIAQPLARLYGRLRHGLIAWRRRTPKKWVIPMPRQSAVFTEHWITPEQRLLDLERGLNYANASFRRGGDYDRWDFEVHGGLFGWARILMAVEDQGSGTQYVRIRSWPVWRRQAIILAIIIFTLSGFALGQSAWPIVWICGTGGLSLLWRGLNESASAQAALLDAVKASNSDEEIE